MNRFLRDKVVNSWSQQLEEFEVIAPGLQGGEKGVSHGGWSQGSLSESGEKTPTEMGNVLLFELCTHIISIVFKNWFFRRMVNKNVYFSMSPDRAGGWRKSSE